MLVNPEQTAMRVGLLLGLDEDERASLGAHLRHIHPQRTANDYFDVPALNETGWSSEQIAIFQDICGATMRKFGYGFGKDYFEAVPSPL